jgi:hypothetical protein
MSTLVCANERDRNGHQRETYRMEKFMFLPMQNTLFSCSDKRRSSYGSFSEVNVSKALARPQ